MISSSESSASDSVVSSPARSRDTSRERRSR
jgi:hypothetical protein